MKKELKEIQDNFIDLGILEDKINNGFKLLKDRIEYKKYQKEYKILKEDKDNKIVYTGYISSINKNIHYENYLKIKNMYPNYQIIEKELI